MPNVIVESKNLGHVTAYAYAKSKGFTGTEEEFAELMASYATVAEQAAVYAQSAEGYSEDSEAYAIGKRNGVDVDSDDPAYHNNSKWYLDQSAQLKQSYLNAYPIKTSSGRVAIFDDGANSVPLKSLLVNMNPIQLGSGEPSLTNVREITGHNSVDIWDDPVYQKLITWNQLMQNGNFADGTSGWSGSGTYSAIKVENGVLTLYASSGSNRGWAARGLASITANHKYVLRGEFERVYSGSDSDANTQYIQSYDGTERYGSLSTSAVGKYFIDLLFTPTADSTGIRIATSASVQLSANQEYFRLSNMMLFDLTTMFGANNEPLSITEFDEMFPKEYYVTNSGEVTSVSAVNDYPYRHVNLVFGSSPGIVYSGTIDTISGELRVTGITKTFDGSEDGWSADSYFMFTLGLLNSIIADTGLCSHAIANSTISKSNNEYGYRVYNRSASPVGATLLFRTAEIQESLMTLTEFKEWLAQQYQNGTPLQVFYELSVPVVYHIETIGTESLPGRNGFWSDVGDILVEYRSDSQLAELKEDIYNAYPTDTVSGDIVGFNDCADNLPLKEFLVTVGLTQSGSGDPSPENPRAIDEHESVNIYFTKNPTPNFTTGSLQNTTGVETASTAYKRTDYIEVPEKTWVKVTYHMPSGGWNFIACAYDSLGNFISTPRFVAHSSTADFTEEFVTPEGCSYIRIAMKSSFSNLNIYVEYNMRTVYFQADTGAITGCILDFVNGKLLKTTNKVLLSDYAWEYVSADQVFRAPRIPGAQKLASGQSADALCTIYPVVSSSDVTQPDYGFAFGVGTSAYMYIRDVRFTDPLDLQAALADVELAYTLNNPEEYVLPFLPLKVTDGSNKLWCDYGNTLIEYYVDIQKYIERLTKPTDEDMIANSNIQSGKFFMVGNSLFLSTASIASGELIVPGTNCTSLSLADALNNLDS